MIPMFKVTMAASAPAAVQEVLESGMIGEGPKVAEFKARIEELFDHSQVTLLNSCTSALTMALRLASVEDKYVISTPLTFAATNCAIKAAHAKIKWCDVDSKTLCAQIPDIINKIDDQTGAVLFTAIAGLVPEDFDVLVRYCNVNSIPLIIDAAHCLNTTYKGKHISHYGDAVAFSFQSIKHLTTGDGGALALNDKDWHDAAEKLKWFGLERGQGKGRLENQRTVDISEWGYKFHMNDIAASIGLANFDRALVSLKYSQLNADFFQNALQSQKKITLLQPAVACTPSWWIYGFLVEDRDEFIDALAAKGITATSMWKRNDDYTSFQEHKDHSLTTLNAIQDKVVFIPNGWWLSEKDLEHIKDTILRFSNG
jgi:dTDP-4-amino-4,6-dideoxygalactose transaminase